MAELNIKQKDGPKRKRLSTRVDLTPMVDLGFLLITFFIFTTTMSEANALNLALPLDSPDSSKSPVSKTISLILGKDNKVWYYNGDSLSVIRATGYGASGLRHVLDQKRKAAIRQFGSAKDLVVLIKPSSAASYQNLVDVMDEMIIEDINTHILMEPSKEELAIVLP